MRFQLNANEVVHELLDGEIIVMHLQSGNYYSLVGSGAEIWTQVIAGAPVDTILAQWDSAATADAEFIKSATHGFVQQLIDEALIVPAPVDVVEAAMALSAPPAGALRPFEPPMIQKFTDMQGLLLVDPIHEVDAMGWPHADGARA
jgi:hypothetical protein